MKTYKSILLSFFPALILYAATSFVNLEINATKWSESARFGYALFSIIIGLGVFGTLYMEQKYK